MEQRPKYDPKPPIPAVELSPRPLEVDLPTSPSPKETNPPPPIHLDGDGVEVDENDLQAMEDEGGKSAPPAAPPERKD